MATYLPTAAPDPQIAGRPNAFGRICQQHAAVARVQPVDGAGGLVADHDPAPEDDRAGREDGPVDRRLPAELARWRRRSRRNCPRRRRRRPCRRRRPACRGPPPAWAAARGPSAWRRSSCPACSRSRCNAFPGSRARTSASRCRPRRRPGPLRSPGRREVRRGRTAGEFAKECKHVHILLIKRRWSESVDAQADLRPGNVGPGWVKISAGSTDVEAAWNRDPGVGREITTRESAHGAIELRPFPGQGQSGGPAPGSARSETSSWPRSQRVMCADREARERTQDRTAGPMEAAPWQASVQA